MRRICSAALAAGALALALSMTTPVALAQPIGEPPPLVKMVQAPGGFPRVPSEPDLAAVETLPIDEVRSLANAGRADARVQLARLLWWNGDLTQPLELLRAPAEAGMPVAQYLLSTYLARRDPPASVRLLVQAAGAGHAVAQEALALLHTSGARGVERNRDEAFRLYLAAGRQGLRNAQMNVGAMLCRGDGVAADVELGRRWFVNSQQGQRMPLPATAGGCAPPDTETAAAAAGGASGASGSASAPGAGRPSREQMRALAASPLGQCLRRPPPYPVAAQRDELEGEVVLAFEVSAAGTAGAPAVARSSLRPLLDAAAMLHLRQCIDSTAEASAGKLPPGRFLLPLTFKLE